MFGLKLRYSPKRYFAELNAETQFYSLAALLYLAFAMLIIWWWSSPLPGGERLSYGAGITSRIIGTLATASIVYLSTVVRDYLVERSLRTRIKIWEMQHGLTRYGLVLENKTGLPLRLDLILISNGRSGTGLRATAKLKPDARQESFALPIKFDHDSAFGFRLTVPTALNAADELNVTVTLQRESALGRIVTSKVTFDDPNTVDILRQMLRHQLTTPSTDR